MTDQFEPNEEDFSIISGARVATTLLHEMDRIKERFGVASLCIGGGMGIAALFERYE